MTNLSPDDLLAAVTAILHGGDHAKAIALLAQTFPDEGLLIKVFARSAGPTSDEDLSELVAALLSWQQNMSSEHAAIAAGLCARAVELLSGDGYTPALESLAEVAQERLAQGQDVAALIQAQVHFAMAAVASSRDGEIGYEQPFITGLKKLPHTDPSYPERLRQLALYLAFRGRLREIASSLPEPMAPDPDVDVDFEAPDAFLPLRFINAIEAGYLDEAQEMAPALADFPLVAPMDEIITAYDSILVLWQQRINLHHDDASDPFADDELIDSFHALFGRDKRAAFKAIEASTYEEIATASTLFGYQSLRLSLALRDVELGQQLLERRQELGLGHWLDQVMWARIALQRGEVATACEHFSRCVRAAEQYDALDRLDFELRASMELSPMQFILLGHRLDEYPSLPILNNPLEDHSVDVQHG